MCVVKMVANVNIRKSIGYNCCGQLFILLIVCPEIGYKLMEIKIMWVGKKKSKIDPIQVL